MGNKKINLFEIIGLPSNLAFIITSLGTLLGSINLSIFLYEKSYLYALIFSIIFSIIITVWIRNYILIEYVLSNRVTLFYESISNKDFKTSWNYISKKYKNETWDDDLSRFIHGFRYSKSINLKSILHLNYINKIHSFIVIYEDTIESPQIMGLKEIQSKNLTEMSEINSYLRKIITKLKKQNLDIEILKNIKAKDLFKKNFSDLLRWHFKIDTFQNVDLIIPTTIFYNSKIVYLKKRSRNPFSKFEIINIHDLGADNKALNIV